ncbi:MAG: hypothetical protein ALAOOOJD_03773 [bacterium]|nr:hypothetical protein [bacterium]
MRFGRQRTAAAQIKTVELFGRIGVKGIEQMLQRFVVFLPQKRSVKQPKIKTVARRCGNPETQPALQAREGRVAAKGGIGMANFITQQTAPGDAARVDVKIKIHLIHFAGAPGRRGKNVVAHFNAAKGILHIFRRQLGITRANRQIESRRRKQRARPCAQQTHIAADAPLQFRQRELVIPVRMKTVAKTETAIQLGGIRAVPRGQAETARVAVLSVETHAQTQTINIIIIQTRFIRDDIRIGRIVIPQTRIFRNEFNTHRAVAEAAFVHDLVVRIERGVTRFDRRGKLHRAFFRFAIPALAHFFIIGERQLYLDRHDAFVVAIDFNGGLPFAIHSFFSFHRAE